MRTLLRIAGLSALGLLFAWGVWLILQTPPPATKPKTSKETPLVQVMPLRAATHPVRIYAYGRVAARDPLDIRPQVEGRIVKMHPALEPGGRVRAGEELVRIDDSDYRLALEEAKSGLEKAKARLAIEGGRRRVAKEELRLLSDSMALDESSRSLALRAPQLQEARAEVLAARNAVERARLQLERTRITAPGDMVVLQRERSEGELVSRGDRIARLASASEAQLSLQVDPRLLTRLSLPEGESPGSRVQITHQGTPYPGRVKRFERQLSPRTRQAQILVVIDDPFNLQPPHRARPPLLIGSYVEAHIEAGELPDSIVIPRAQLLDDRRVWVVDESQRLQIRNVDILFEEPDRVFARPLSGGDRLLLGNPAGLIPGTIVRTPSTP